MEKIDRLHPRYANLYPDWQFWESAYIGGKDHVARYLSRHEAEGREEFTARKARAFRENHCKAIVDRVNDHLCQHGPVRQYSDSSFDLFVRNAGGPGKSLDDFMRNASRWASVLGRVYVHLDVTDAGQPICRMIKPQDVTDIAFAEDGSTSWAIIRELTRDDHDPLEGTGAMIERVRLMEPGRWTLYSEQSQIIGQGETGLGFVPLFPLDNEESPENPFSGYSMLTSIAPIDRAIMDNWSRLDAIANDQAFSQLTFPVEAMPLPEALDNAELREKLFTLGPGRVLLYSAGAGQDARPEYISPDARQAATIMRMIVEQTQSCYGQAGLRERTYKGLTPGAEPVSGWEKAVDLEALSRLLSTKAANLERVERLIAHYWGRMTGRHSDIEITYPRRFDVAPLVADLEHAKQLAVLNLGQTFRREFHKRLVAKAMPMVPQEAMAKITAEIDSR